MARTPPIRVNITGGGVNITGARRPRDPDEIATGRELGQSLCRIFGLTPERTTSLTITMDPNDVARVTVEQWVTQGQAAELIELATTYGLHKAPPRVTLGPGYTVHHQRGD